ncbi:hypothetical protein AB205_0138540, partial [Aquarana catesbeiana]
EVLKHLQGKLEHDVGTSASQCDILDQMKGDAHGLYNQYATAGSSDTSVILGRASAASSQQSNNPQKKERAEGSSIGTLKAELERERSLLLGEIDKEEKEKLWYYSQLQSLSKRLEELPQVET